jgi:hypothetical protein
VGVQKEKEKKSLRDMKKKDVISAKELVEIEGQPEV